MFQGAFFFNASLSETMRSYFADKAEVSIE